MRQGEQKDVGGAGKGIVEPWEGTSGVRTCKVVYITSSSERKRKNRGGGEGTVRAGASTHISKKGEGGEDPEKSARVSHKLNCLFFITV